MCTIILVHRLRTDASLIVAANRDEWLARWTRRATRQQHRGVRFLAGTDLEKGGTWLGASERGLFVGLTNLPPQPSLPSPPPGGFRSRGELVREVLACPSLGAAERLLRSINGTRWRGFHLAVGDGHRLVLAYGHPAHAELSFEEAAPGVHVLPNGRLNDDQPKVRRARALLRTLNVRGAELDFLLGELHRRVLADRVRPDRVPVHPSIPEALLREVQALCVQTPRYGTRSAALIALRPGRVLRYEAVEGVPGRAPVRSVAGLLPSFPRTAM
ncbi:MAG: NRDE family protein [Myxococcota bacterium]